MFPRVLAVILLVTSVLMLAPIGAAVIEIARGEEVAVHTWAVPMVILAIGTFLTSLLSRRQISFHLYLAAFALWILTAGYFVFRFMDLP
jgi:hypothetical protein